MASTTRIYRLSLFGAVSCIVGFAGHLYFQNTLVDKSKLQRVSRVTKLSNNQQREYNVGNCSLLITPSFGNVHAILVNDENVDEDSINHDFKMILNKYVDWNSDTISFGNIPEKQLPLIQQYWKQNRNDQYEIGYHHYIFRLNKEHFEYNDDIIQDIADSDIYVKPLEIEDLDHVLNLNKYDKLFFTEYIKQILETGQIAMGVYYKDIAEPIGTALIHTVNSSFGALAVDEQFRRKGIAFKLSKIVLNEHFKQGSEYVIACVLVGNTPSIQLMRKLGFKRLEGTYYWMFVKNNRFDIPTHFTKRD